MKNCIIIHGCPSDKEKALSPERRTYDKHWIPWTKVQLTAKNIKTETPLMPEPWEPDYKKFKNEFAKYEVNENTILIGHSCGNSFLVRWLSETKTKIAKLILVAPWKIGKDSKKLNKDFYEFPIDNTISERTGEIIMFTADNEAVEGKNGLKMFHDALGGEVINLPNHGHYCFKNMGTEEFPELLEVILK